MANLPPSLMSQSDELNLNYAINQRFRRFLPVVVDIETGGFDCRTAPIVEIALYFLKTDNARLHLDDCLHFHIEPFTGSQIEQKSMEFIGYQSDNIRHKKNEKDALSIICEKVKQRVKKENCTRAILVGQNAHFDLAFFNAATERCQLTSPFHHFSTLDTASTSALLFGHTVLCQACQMAGIEWDNERAHSALYDCEQTAKLFCHSVNEVHSLYSKNKK